MTENSRPGSDDDATDGTTADRSGLADAIEGFLDRTDAALSEYDDGYTDADATLRVVRSNLAALREAVDEGDDE